jgi:hypothetical protein
MLLNLNASNYFSQEDEIIVNFNYWDSNTFF